MTPARGSELPTWAGVHLGYHAARGACVHDLLQLRSLYSRIDAYRLEAGVGAPNHLGDVADTVLGDIPEDPALRMKRCLLAEEAFPSRTSLARTGMAREGL